MTAGLQTVPGERNLEQSRIHSTAIIEGGVEIGTGTVVWDNVHIRRGASIGMQCIIGEKTYIAYDVRIGDRVKINAFVYICTGVTLQTGVMVSAGVIFTNDRWPRATTPDLLSLRSSDPDEHTLLTRVREGATIGAGSVIGCNLEIGRFAMVGMGSVVTGCVPDFGLAVGNPARLIGHVCRCGTRLRAAPAQEERAAAQCRDCGRGYFIEQGTVRELLPLETTAAASFADANRIR